MDFKQIQELIKIVGKSDLCELSIQQDNFKITLKKGSTPITVRQADLRVAPIESSAVQSTLEATGETAGVSIAPRTNKQEKPATDDRYITVKSPMVGTFYRSPSPDKEPFVKVGDIIRKGDHICVIEAMKLFNEIESEYEGKVLKVLVEDAKPVEYEQPLFLIEPT